MRPSADGTASKEVSAAAAVAHIFLWASMALLGRRRLHIKTRSLSHCLTQSLTNTHGECFDSRFQAAKMSCVRLSRWCKQQSSKAPSQKRYRQPRPLRMSATGTKRRPSCQNLKTLNDIICIKNDEIAGGEEQVKQIGGWVGGWLVLG